MGASGWIAGIAKAGLAASVLLSGPDAVAQPLAPVGCPVFHCTPQATGVMYQPLLPQLSAVRSNAALGALKGQGCSGNGDRLYCLFFTDTTPSGQGAGTLKAVDGVSLQPIWGSADVAGSINLDAASSAGGQAPVVFASGEVVAGDRTRLVKYDAAGSVVASLPLQGQGNNLGLTPIGSSGLGVVSQTDGVLTLVDLSSWAPLQTLVLRDSASPGRIALVSPSAAAEQVLYAVGRHVQTGAGYLMAVRIDTQARSMSLRARFVFDGKSEASPVVLTPAVTGRSANVVLIHAPGMNGDGQHRLQAILDTATALTPLWALNLPGPMPVTPAIDEAGKFAYVRLQGSSMLSQVNLLDGTPVQDFDLAAIGGYPPQFVLNGHLASVQAGGQYTLLLSGGVTGVPRRNGQYVIGFSPLSSPGAVLWSRRVRLSADSSTAAWNLAASLQPGSFCPVVAGSPSGLTRVCDH